MKYQSCFMIKCIISDNDTIQNNFSKKLGMSLKTYWPLIEIELKRAEKYWKDETERVLIYNVSYVDHLSIHDFISHFNIHWEYISSYVNDVIKHQTVTKEEAIWSKLCYENEVFITPEVEWVHIYTWLNMKYTIISTR